VEQVVQGYLESGWEDFAAANREIVQEFLDRFRQLADTGPAHRGIGLTQSATLRRTSAAYMTRRFWKKRVACV